MKKNSFSITDTRRPWVQVVVTRSCRGSMNFYRIDGQMAMVVMLWIDGLFCAPPIYHRTGTVRCSMRYRYLGTVLMEINLFDWAYHSRSHISKNYNG